MPTRRSESRIKPRTSLLAGALEFRAHELPQAPKRSVPLRESRVFVAEFPVASNHASKGAQVHRADATLYPCWQRTQIQFAACGNFKFSGTRPLSRRGHACPHHWFHQLHSDLRYPSGRAWELKHPSAAAQGHRAGHREHPRLWVQFNAGGALDEGNGQNGAGGKAAHRRSARSATAGARFQPGASPTGGPAGPCSRQKGQSSSDPSLPGVCAEPSTDWPPICTQRSPDDEQTRTQVAPERRVSAWDTVGTRAANAIAATESHEAQMRSLRRADMARPV